MLHRGAASSTLQRSCSTGYFRQHSKLKADCRLFDKRWRVSAASKQSDRGLSEHEREVLRKAVLATAVCCAFASNVGAARADSQNWVPRRHHRHIGERFTDTWADSIVEVCVRVVTWHQLLAARMLACTALLNLAPLFDSYKHVWAGKLKSSSSSSSSRRHCKPSQTAASCSSAERRVVTVQIEQAASSRVRELERQLEQERKRADVSAFLAAPAGEAVESAAAVLLVVVLY
eukprot:GHRQ01037893.1.p1 GENE.GHRQ01037893.1~~GHRQ01037893.1.p1  ORF type:complete len:232 (+),score=48.71 GHRQ01037893.1:87-782(+)